MTDRVFLETKGIEEFLEEIKDQPKRLERVMREAANNAVRPMKARITTDIAREIGIGRNKFTHRVIYRAAKRGAKDPQRSSARAWTGLNPIPARTRYFGGRIKQDERGAYANEYFFEDGFIVNYGSQKVIYKRVNGSPARTLLQSLTQQEVEIQKVDIERPETIKIIDDAADQAREKYVQEAIRLVKVDWSKVKRKVRRG